MKPYVIIAPPYRGNCGGIRVLHYFCSLLNNNGCEAYITGWNSPPFLNVRPAKDLTLDKCKQLQQEAICVYPEIIQGNPCKFRNVVRWDLAPARFTYIPQDLVFVHGRIFSHKSTSNELLHITAYEDFFSLPSTDNRFHTLFWKGKNQSATLVPETSPDWIEITYSYPSDRRELAKLLQTAKILYSYDPISGLNTEARLCGCPVVVIPTEAFTSEDIKARQDFGLYGLVVYGEEFNYDKLILETKKTVDMYQYHKNVIEKEQLSRFIELTQKLDSTYVEDIRAIDYNHRPWLMLDKFN